MQSKMLNSTLIDNWNASRNKYDVDLTIYETYAVSEMYVNGHYFFLKRELEVTKDGWAEAKWNGLIRHCKIYKGKFLDYVVHKEFNTIEEWVRDAGGQLKDVLYGENRVNKQYFKYDSKTGRAMPVPYVAKYVYLTDLLNVLGYDGPVVETRSDVEIPTTTTRDLTDMISLEMRMRGLTIDNVYVISGSEVTSWKSFMSH